MADDTENGFAMRHRARRAALLVEVLHEWARAEQRDVVDLAVALYDADWIRAAEEAGITAPSDITRNIAIGLLSVPALQGLVRE